MSLDTKYRPITFADVLGQSGIIRILRQYVIKGRGFHQSYLFAGPFGSGKTTLGRIMARALLCEAPNEGEPCNQCHSCRSILERGVSECFVEVDAATSSGKEDITRITEEIEYDTFSGKRRIYLFDEAHQLSRDALDALLKPLEENVQGSNDKKLVCIFCTTEPEKMRATIQSRCSSFTIQPMTPGVIADRLAYVCQQEGFEYDLDCLKAIAEATECHIRDALKAVEGVSLLGAINAENVAAYLNLDLNGLYLDVLDALGTDLGKAMSLVEKILLRSSPTTCYQRLADAAMTAYKLHLGAQKPATFWDPERLQKLAARGEALLGIASRFATRPGRPTTAMLLCDLAQIHHLGGRVVPEGAQVVFQVQQTAPGTNHMVASKGSLPSSGQNQHNLGSLQVAPIIMDDEKDPEVYVDPKAARRREDKEADGGPRSRPLSPSDTLPPDEFCRLLGLRIAELGGDAHGLAGRHYLDRG